MFITNFQFRLFRFFLRSARAVTVLTIAGISLLLANAQAQTFDSVALAMDKIVSKTAPLLTERNLTVINVGKFDEIAGTSSGAEIQLKLMEAFQRHGGFTFSRIEYRAKIIGRIELLELQNAKIVRVAAQLFDARNKPLAQVGGKFEVTEDISGNEAVPRLFGIAVSLSGDESSSQIQQITAEAMERDGSFIRGSEVFSSPDSPYSMEILLKNALEDKYQPVMARLLGESHRPFTEIPMDHDFAIRLNNYTDKEAAVNLTLDGVSSFAFSEVRRGGANWLVPKAEGQQPGSITIHGWDKNDLESFKFRTVGFPKGALAELDLEPNEAMGQITAQFSESYEKGSARTRSIGKGELILEAKKSVPRDIGPLRSTIHIRYERPEGN